MTQASCTLSRTKYILPLSINRVFCYTTYFGRVDGVGREPSSVESRLRDRKPSGRCSPTSKPSSRRSHRDTIASMASRAAESFHRPIPYRAHQRLAVPIRRPPRIHAAAGGMINAASCDNNSTGRARKPRHVRLPGELARAQEARRDEVGQPRERITTCVEINQCVECTR